MSDRYEAIADPELNDLRARAEDFLVQCGPCDAGLPMGCACPTDDPRPVIAALLDSLDRYHAAFIRANAACSAREEQILILGGGI